jgi:hypothetical protein
VATRRGIVVELRVVAAHVDGVPIGIYRYEPPDTLRLVGPIDRPELEDLVLQREFARAPAILTAVGTLGRAVTAHGSQGYRSLLVRGGAAVQAAWFAALRRDLVGAAFAGLLPHVLRQRADVDGFQRAALLAFAVGRPVPVDQPGPAAV